MATISGAGPNWFPAHYQKGFNSISRISQTVVAQATGVDPGWKEATSKEAGPATLMSFLNKLVPQSTAGSSKMTPAMTPAMTPEQGRLLGEFLRVWGTLGPQDKKFINAFLYLYGKSEFQSRIDRATFTTKFNRPDGRPPDPIAVLNIVSAQMKSNSEVMGKFLNSPTPASGYNILVAELAKLGVTLPTLDVTPAPATGS